MDIAGPNEGRTAREQQALHADVLVAGGGVGGCAAALAAAEAGLRVVLTEETAWIGGQLTSQITPLDEPRLDRALRLHGVVSPLSRGGADLVPHSTALDRDRPGASVSQPGQRMGIAALS